MPSIDDALVRESLSIEEASRASSLGEKMIRRAINSGKLPARKAGRRTLILRGDLASYLSGLPVLELKTAA